MSTAADPPRWWVAGDWNGFFGLFTNVVLNVIVLTGLCLDVVQLPAAIVYGRILPALGIALPFGNLYYAYLAWRLAKQRGAQRRDGDAVRAVGAAHVHRRLSDHAADLSEDARCAARLALPGWCGACVIGAIVLLGAFVGPTVRKYTPRAAMLGTLAGISIAFISMRPAFLGWEDPWLFHAVARRSCWSAGRPGCGCRSACRAALPRWRSAPCSPGSLGFSTSTC